MKRTVSIPYCYYCGLPAVSREHVPPQMMFPKGIDKITVPSCEKHNGEKSGNDAAIISFLIRAITQNGPTPTAIEAQQAIQNAKETINQMRNKYPNILLLNASPYDPSELANYPDQPSLPPDISINAWIVQLTAALVYKGANGLDSAIDWDKTTVMSPQILSTPDTAPFTWPQLAPSLQKQHYRVEGSV